MNERGPKDKVIFFFFGERKTVVFGHWAMGNRGVWSRGLEGELMAGRKFVLLLINVTFTYNVKHILF